MLCLEMFLITFAVLAKHKDGYKFVLVSSGSDGVIIKETTSLDQTRPMCELEMSDVVLGSDAVFN